LLLAQFDSKDRVSAIRRYREFVMTPQSPDNALDESGSPVLGDDFYVARFQSAIERACSEVPRRSRQLGARIPLGALFSGRGTRATRNTQIIEAHGQGYAMAEIARYLRIHYSTVSKIIADAVGSDLES
jgi:DNA-binding NarL/FixJ family response regulator